MRVKLIRDIPVGRKHNLVAGRVLETIDPPEGKEYLAGVWVQGAGNAIRLLASRPKEYVMMEAGDAD